MPARTTSGSRPGRPRRRPDRVRRVARPSRPSESHRGPETGTREFFALPATLAGRPKLILDRRAAGRRHLWLADPERLGPGLGRALAAPPGAEAARAPELED